MRRRFRTLPVLLITIALSTAPAPAREAHRPRPSSRPAAPSHSVWEVLPDVWRLLPPFLRAGGCHGDGCTDRVQAIRGRDGICGPASDPNGCPPSCPPWICPP